VQIALPGLLGDQEMKDSPVVPGPVTTLGMPAEHVGGQPANPVGSRAEAIPRVLHPGRRDVENGEVTEPEV